MPEFSQAPVRTEQFLKHVGHEDALAQVVSIHKDLGVMLSALLDQRLKRQHFVELDRLAFPVKVDLADALNLMGSKIRSPLLKLNSIRNSLAHGDLSAIDAELVRDFYNTFDDPQVRHTVGDFSPATTEHNDLFKQLAAVLFVILEIDLKRVMTQQLYDEALREEVQRLVRPDRKFAAGGWEKRIEERVEELKRERWKVATE